MYCNILGTIINSRHTAYITPGPNTGCLSRGNFFSNRDKISKGKAWALRDKNIGPNHFNLINSFFKTNLILLLGPFTSVMFNNFFSVL